LIDDKVIYDLFNILAISGHEEKVIDFISDYLKKINVGYKMDEVGNIYGFNYKNKPMVSAHTDTVQNVVDGELLKFIKIRNDILSGYGVIGGDDKCGIYAILKLLKEGEKVNFLFSVSEETGGSGSQYFIQENASLISSVPYCIVLDRKGNSDIIGLRNFYCEEDLSEVVRNIGNTFGYDNGIGTFSDANNISEYTPCVNLSVGYYNPHSNYEYVNLKDLKNAIDFTHSIIKNVSGKFKIPSNPRHLPFEFEDNYNGYYDYCDDIIDDKRYVECDSCGVYTNKRHIKYIKAISCSLCTNCFNNLIEELSFELDYGYDFNSENSIKYLNEEAKW
jgi:tripeptide aminopeptidase